MATNSPTRLQAAPRTIEGSRATRRLRRSGRVPGVLYGGGKDPLAFDVDARELRHAIAASGAVVEIAIEGAASPAVLKDSQRHPVRGETMHVDFLRVDLTQAIEATVVLELTGADEAPGVIEGGILEQVTHEVTIEALPNEIPEHLTVDVSGMAMNDTLTLAAVKPPSGVTIIDDLDETVIANLTPPRLEVESDEEIEQETERVGGGATADEAAAEANDVPESAGDGAPGA
jgi:large subunit ribosomal protein L25